MSAITLDAKSPSGPLASKWERHQFEMKLVNPANKRKYSVIVVGSGLAGGSAAATLGELGYNVSCFCFQDSPRRAHSPPMLALRMCVSSKPLSRIWRPMSWGWNRNTFAIREVNRRIRRSRCWGS